MRFNPPPGWPPAPEGWAPGPGWQPDPSWPPPPPGWQLWISDDQPGAPGSLPQAPLPSYPSVTRPGDVYDPRAANATSGFAIASLVLGIMGGVLLSAIFGFVALAKIRDTGQKGRGMAIAGIILSGVWVVVAVVAVVASHGHAAAGPNGQASTNLNSGPRASSGTVNVHGLAVGDCFDWSPSTRPVVSITLIPCGQAHNVQVFAVWELSGSSYPPGSSYPSDLHQVVDQGCFARKTNLNASASSLQVDDFRPTAVGWSLGDRTVYCMVASPTADLKSSVLTS